jgi:hypothetical protein
MQCPKCQSNVYDNRADKASGAKSPKWPDFKCQSKTCDWAQWPPKATPANGPPPVVAPQAIGASRDTYLIELYWDSFDRILAGLKSRALSTGFHDEQIAACVATLFIQRARG